MTPRQIVSYTTLAVCLISPWEGLWLTARPDMLARGLPTVCYGMTSYDRPVRIGDTYTERECEQFLTNDVPKYYEQIEPCIHVKLSEHEKAALTSLAYNVGAPTVCKSQAIKQFNSGQHERGCRAIANFTRANGKVIKGLVNRRRDEVRICLTKDAS